MCMYVYVCICMHVCMCVYIYIYIFRESIPTRVLGEIVLRTVFGDWTMGIPNMVDVLG